MPTPLEEALKKALFSIPAKREPKCILAISNGITENCAALIESGSPPRVTIRETWVLARLTRIKELQDLEKERQINLEGSIKEVKKEITDLLISIAYHLPQMKPFVGNPIVRREDYLAISRDLRQSFRSHYPEAFKEIVDQNRFRVSLTVEVLDEQTGIVEVREQTHYGFRDWDINRTIAEAADKVAMNVARFDETLEAHVLIHHSNPKAMTTSEFVPAWSQIRIEENKAIKTSGFSIHKSQKHLLRKTQFGYQAHTEEEAKQYDNAINSAKKLKEDIKQEIWKGDTTDE